MINISYCKLLLSTLFLLTMNLRATEAGLSFGAHDFIVSNINTPEFNNGDSHNFGVNFGIFVNHTTPSGIVLKADAEIFFEQNKDNLDPDHAPIWSKINFSGDGPIYNMSDNFSIRWLVDLQNRKNTLSAVELELKQFYGVGIDYNNGLVHLALNGYSGFFYLEIDDDVPVSFGYNTEDLSNGTSAVSLMLDGSIKLTQNFELSGYLQNYSNISTGRERLENQFMVKVSYDTGALIDLSKVHLKVEHTQYNFDVYFRDDIGVPVLPWDNDTLLQAYVTIPWKL